MKTLFKVGLEPGSLGFHLGAAKMLLLGTEATEPEVTDAEAVLEGCFKVEV